MPAKTKFSIITWNVNGLGEKKKDQEFLNIITRYDMICLMETWSSVRTNVKLSGYEKPLHRYRHKRRKKGRRSGGLLLYYKKHLAAGIKEIPKTHEDLLWVKLDKEFFSFISDVYLCTAYIAPQYSTTTNAAFLQMEKDAARFSKLGDIALFGDFNARTSNLKDYIENDTRDKYIQNANNYSVDRPKHNIVRCNQDTKINARGKDLVNLCKSADLRILNGRTIGDLMGDYTVIKSNGKSVVDYNIVSKQFLHNIIHFRVGDPNYLSDHNFLESVIRCELNDNITKVKKSPMRRMYDRFIWEMDSSVFFNEAINDNDTKGMIRNFLENQYDENNTNIAVNDFTSILAQAGNKVLKLKHSKGLSPNKGSAIKYPWFDNNCYGLRQSLRQKGKQLKRSKDIKEDSQKFRISCRKYKKLLREKKKEYKQKLLKEMESLKSSNPKLYWNLLEKLRNCDREPKSNDASNISAEEWYKHFKELAKEDNNETDCAKDISDINTKLKKLEKDKFLINMTDLDYPFTIKEIKSAIKSSRNGKSSSDDLVLNEMLKSGLNVLLPALCKLFNLVLNSEVFPDLWNIAYQVPLFKGGDVYNPNDYRGISITSCLGKIFNKCLNVRLQDKIERDKKLVDSQAAYRADFSTVDQIFILRSLINKYTIQSRKKLYGCFVDFKKAFDSVWHNGLMFKLLAQYQIGGKFYGVLKSMYSTARACVKLPDGITESFPIQRGIKQGDTLSPYLFNLYLNDINGIFTQQCCPPQLGTHYVKCLLYADDLLILSESKQGLQNSLTKLKEYCTKWKLKLNVKKTKVLIFSSKSTKDLSQYWFGQDKIEIVDKYTYLGITFTNNGKLTEAVKVLQNKALKGMFSLCSSLYTGITVKPHLPLSVFDSTIRPILVYGSEVWASDFTKLLSKPSQIDKAPFEQVQNKFCKYIIGLPRRASNFAVKAELGRSPIFTFICSQALRYCIKIMNTDQDRILSSAFNSELEIHRNGGTSWVSFIVKLLELNQAPTAWASNAETNLSDITPHLKTFSSNCKNTITQLYVNFSRDSVGEHSKLRTYITFKNDFEMERYLHVEDIPNKMRRLFCSFRVSCHDLEIERGRYGRTPKLPEQRICKICNLQPETEEHFVLFCPGFMSFRRKMFEKIAQFENNILSVPHNDRFVFLMSNKNPDIIKTVMVYLNNAYCERNLILRGKQ